MTNTAPETCCDERRQNIPWYVNGTLSDRATATLREHLETCGDCQADLALHTQMRGALLGRELTPMRPATRADDIIGAPGAGRRASTGLGSQRLAAIAAGIAILAVGLFLLLYPKYTVEPDNQVFQTATSSQTPGNIDYVLQLRFEERVSPSERARIAAELDGAVKWAVNDKGVYEVHVRFAVPSLEVLQAYEAATDSISGVQSAEFIALQLPVR